MKPVELHGNIQRTKCLTENIVVSEWPQTAEAPPRCPRCGGWLRPDVVWFGEMLPEKETEAAFAASRHCDLFLSVGTSSIVHPAAALPLEALEAGADVVEVNLSPTPLTGRVTHVLAGAAGVILPELVRAMRAE